MAEWDIADYGRSEDVAVAEAPQNAEELTALLKGRFEYADAYRKQWDDKVQDWWRLYIVWSEEIGKDDPRYGRSNLNIPRPYEEIDAVRARLVKSFFGSRPYIDFIPIPRGDWNPEIARMREDSARLASALVDEQLDRCEITVKWYEFITNMLVFPAAVMSVGWRYETKVVKRRVPIPTMDPFTGQVRIDMVEQEEQAVVWDDNELQVVAWEDQWCDPRGYDLDSARFFFHREIMTLDKLESKLEVLEQTGNGERFPLDIDTLFKQGDSLLGEGKWERFSSVGISDPGGDHWAAGEKPGNVIEVLHYWTDDEYGMLINRDQLAWYGANPYWRHGKKPYIMASYEPVTGQPYGISAMQIIEPLAHELNTQRNQRIDNVSFSLNIQRKVRRSADIDFEQLVSRPGGVIEVDSMDDVMDMPPAPIQVGAYQEEAIIKQDMENALGVSPVMRGVDAVRKETATEIMAKQSNAGIRFEVRIALYQVKAVNRLAMLMDMNNQQFVDSQRYVRVYGATTMGQWQMMEPHRLIGEYDYRPAGANIDPAANREARRNQLMQLMEIVWKLDIPYVNRYELFRALVDTFDLRNTAKIVIPYEELMEQMMQQQAQQEQMMQQQAAQDVGAPMPMAPEVAPQMAQAPALMGGPVG